MEVGFNVQTMGFIQFLVVMMCIFVGVDDLSALLSPLGCSFIVLAFASIALSQLIKVILKRGLMLSELVDDFNVSAL